MSIFINHIPGMWWEAFTHRNLSFSDAAELFVFLAGWSVRRLADGQGRETPALGRLLFKLSGRAVQLYAVQLFLTLLAISFIAGVALSLDNPLVLAWNNAQAVFQDPVRTHVGIVILTHQLGYFDILPLYVVLMAGAPLMVAVDRLSRAVLLLGALGLYGGVLATGWNAPTWPVEGTWYFNPLAWQLVFVAGFLAARWSAGEGPLAVLARRLPVQVAAWAIVIASAIVVRLDAFPDPVMVPEPTLFFVVDKTFLTPLRLIQFLALVVAMAPLHAPIARFAPLVDRYCCGLGRVSLNVFCVASLGSLASQLFRFMFGSGFLMDSLLLVVGVVLLGATAWVSERRERGRGESAS